MQTKKNACGCIVPEQMMATRDGNRYVLLVVGITIKNRCKTEVLC